MKTIKINLSSSSYSIKLGKDAIYNLPEYLKEIGFSKKLVIITDKNVKKLHLTTLENILNKGNIDFSTIVIDAGEEYKTLETVSNIYNELCEIGVTRQDAILAFGGGVTGDISGFVAATYLRGIKYIQVPTTLLSQVDSSIGGKTGVDLKAGKNLVGAFCQPKLVVADISLLKTLDDTEVSSGMAEIIKAGFIGDKELVLKLLNSKNLYDDIEEFILRAINVKKEIVEIDEFEKNERMLLNFGHTFGHSIEKYYDFKGITHGQAVAVGMCLITKDKDVKEKLIKILEKYNLKTKTDIPIETILKLCRNDKKALKDSINIVTVEEIGKGKIENLSFDKLGEIYGNNKTF